MCVRLAPAILVFNYLISVLQPNFLLIRADSHMPQVQCLSTGRQPGVGTSVFLHPSCGCFGKGMGDKKLVWLLSCRGAVPWQLS